MAAAHHAAQDSRYSLPPPPNPYNNRRLPSLKDLNFSYRLPPLAQDSPSSGHVSVAVDPSAQLQDHSVRQDHAIRQEHPMRPDQPMRQDHSVRQDHQVRQDIRQDPTLRHVEQWRRANAHASISPASTHHPEPQQQHTPPLSASHEQSAHKIMEYSHPPPRHEHGGYVAPGMPLSGQMAQAPAPMASSSGTVRGGDDLSHMHSHHKRPRTSSSSSVDVPRDARPPPMSYSPAHYTHTPYMHPPQSHQAHQGHQAHQQPPPPPHPSHHQHQQHPASPYPPMPPGPPVHPSPSPHTHNMHHHSPVQPHPGYAPYQQSYMPPSQPRPPEVHAQHPHHMNPAYQSPVHPPPPPPQDHWEQPHSQLHAHHHPPAPSHPMHQHHHQQPIPAPAPVAAPAPAPAPPAIPAPAPPPVQQHPHQHIQPQTMHIPAPPPPPVQQPQPQPSFTRTTALVPTDVDTRTASYPPNGASARESLVSEITKHCSLLYTFASRYAQMQASIPHSQPSPAELADMQHRANYVVRLLEDLRRQMQPDSERVRTDSPVTVRSPDDHRQPKRPWEDMSHDGAAGETEGSYPEEYASPDPPPKAPSAAELDMELIRNKRATSSAGGGGSIGQTKNKYRKRSSGQRATPPGKCHSCNIRETPEWRRGPDGARTLCNACGLHYAKLMRKQDKQHNGAEPPRIDMDTLRASARAAEQDKSHSRSAKHQARRKTEPESPIERPSTSQQAQHHQSTFQLVPVAPAQEQSPISDTSRLSSQPSIHPPPPAVTSMAAPPPPWATNSRAYSSDQMQPQSFVRTAHSHPPTR
ncbi:hypothetical protein IW261DRAFT_1476042 [Armillaria novae-zelandiae]|uniref:GATA-type domain-containing protein n=1 Tax=Armillaria novae-zelandiae TaxID=153914 RepID=A0AA39U8J0_9AGAR|nr:hypothetical protein IW261DRAFT_1476042 [Armillaria novae-zelandiae]